MSAPSKSNKHATRWGGFLQQAVATVESRLDTILAEDEASTNKNAPIGAQAEKPAIQNSASAQVKVEGKTGGESNAIVQASSVELTHV